MSLKVGFIDYWSSVDNLAWHFKETYLEPLKNAGIDVDMTPYDPREIECDIIFHSVFSGPSWKFCKFPGNPVFICYTGENRLEQWKHPDGYSMSFSEDSDTNIYYPIWQDTFKMYEKYRLKEFPKKEKFATFIVSNPFANFRNSVFNFINDNYKHIDSCGKAMNNMSDGFVLPHDFESAVDFHKDYKFNFCFENSKSYAPNVHYITEKLGNAFAYGVIPIYWGDDSVTKWFNPKSFINCNNKSIVEIMNEIKYLDTNEDAYYEMLNQYPYNDDINWTEYQKQRYIDFIKKIIKERNLNDNI